MSKSAVTFRVVVLAVLLAGIGDIVSDFLYLQEELKVKAPARPVAEVVTGIGERYLGLVDADGAVRVWDFETGGQVAVEGRRPRQARAVFPNQRGANLIVAEADGRVYETAGMSFATKATLLGTGAAADAVAVSPRAPVVAAAGGGRLQVYNLVTRRTVAVPMKDRVTGLWVSDDGRFVAYEAGAVAWVLDADRQASLPIEPASPAGRILFYYDSTGAPGLARQDSPARLGLYKHDGQAFARAGEHTFGSGPQDFWIRTGGQIYWTSKNTLSVAPLGAGRGRTVFTAKEPIAHIRNVKAGDDLLIVHRSGVLAVLNAKTGKLVATGLSTENGWAVIDSSKRYDGSVSGSREIAWVIQKIDLDLEKFARHFYEPGLLLHYVSPQQLAFASAGHQGPIPLPPTIAEMKLLENVAGSGRTVVLATARNVKDDVSGIEVYHNGKRVSDTARITDETARRDDLKFRSVGFGIHPMPGPNTLAVMGVGRLGIEGPTRELAFERPGAASRVLHVVAVGIDRYAASALKLGYARRDAEAIAQLMRASKGFDRVAVAELHDANAGREPILATLRATAAAASPGDAIVVYLAGHGLAIRGGWYFLSPAIVEPEESEIVRLSVSAEQIAATLRESRASRIVLMIDSCNSGAVVKDIKGLLQNRVYAQLGRATGFAVLAASRQDQAALERATLGHGVFTAATVAALTGAADRNGDGRVTARELAGYLSRQIPTLATEHLNEIQIPVAYAPSEDFVVRSLR
ncbi:MAG TPA: caspase family protein [Methylomirabilota bacterium]|nr:caspase family protein [Methylomirabilota bacterium]